MKYYRFNISVSRNTNSNTNAVFERLRLYDDTEDVHYKVQVDLGNVIVSDM